MIKNDINIGELIYKLQNKNRAFRISIFICGVLIYAISFSLFFLPHNIVSGGTTGLSIIIKELFGINTSLFVLVVSLLLLIVGYIYLGKYDTIKACLGSILLPIFIEFSSVYYELFNLQLSSLFLVVFIGGILMGLGSGLIIRSGYTVGGFQIIYKILYKKFGIAIGKSTLWINGILVLIGAIYFGPTSSLYAIIGLYISSIVTDKIMLETSITKTFYIITEHDKAIKQYIIDNLGYGLTIINAKGGYTNKNKKVLVCSIPTRQYYELKKMLQQIDKDVFFLITDTYEIYGGM